MPDLDHLIARLEAERGQYESVQIARAYTVARLIDDLKNVADRHMDELDTYSRMAERLP